MNVDNLGPLLDHLAATRPDGDGQWAGWQVARVAGSGNNLLYHARCAGAELAVKFTIRDARDRAGREYATLWALQTAGRALAPAPVLLDRDRYPQPVVVQSWLSGTVAAEPPASEAGWLWLLGHYAAIHTVTPESTSVPLPPAVVNMDSAEAGKARIRDQLARVPRNAWPVDTAALVKQVEATPFPTWPAPARRLCRCDPNPLNFVRRAGAWASVDWENSGWGDPAFEIADLLAHPAYRTLDATRRAWVVATYCALSGEPEAAGRIAVYYPLMLVWWVAWWTRTLYEVPRGLGPRRLVERPATWWAGAQDSYADYVARARVALP